MPWPQPQQYNEAIQIPSESFTDPDLKQGTVKTNRLGLPLVMAGAFANVYQIQTPTGSWAVRCFVREVADTRWRYEEISRTLKTLGLSFTAPFVFIPEGIKVGGKMYPIVKMQWMTGKLIGDYVADNATNPQSISSLAKKWVEMSNALRKHGIAHGDLQHGNVMVVGSELMLIDYDGMFVPSFKGKPANELGHPDYQHPQRKHTDFGEHIDNFSSWVIYASLKALAEQPSLFSLSRGLGRDEVILFNRDDYRSPGTSALLSHIKATAEKNTVDLCDRITSFTNYRLADIPPLDPTQYAISLAGAGTTSIGPSDWWREHITPSLGEISAQTHKVEISVREFGPQKQLIREIIWLLVLSVAALFGLLFTGLAGGFGYSAIQLTLIFIFYKRTLGAFEQCAEVAAKNRHFQEISIKEESLTHKKQALQNLQKRQREITGALASLSASLDSEISKITAEQGSDIRKAHTAAAVKRSSLEVDKQQIRFAYERELAQAASFGQSQITAIKTEIASLSQIRSSLIAKELEGIRLRMLNSFLHGHKLYDAIIPGIGNTFKFRLFNSGLHTAADLEVSRIRTIEGFGYTRTKAVMDWKRSLAENYINRLPTSLPSGTAAIDSQIQARRTELEQRLAAITLQMQNNKKGVEDKFKTSFDGLESREHGINSDCSAQITHINNRYLKLITAKRSEHEIKLSSLKREDITIAATINSLQLEIARLESWIANEAPLHTESFSNITFLNYLRAFSKTP